VSIGHQSGAVDKLTVVVLKARNLPSNSDVTNGCPGYQLTGALASISAYDDDDDDDDNNNNNNSNNNTTPLMTPSHVPLSPREFQL